MFNAESSIPESCVIYTINVCDFLGAEITNMHLNPQQKSEVWSQVSINTCHPLEHVLILKSFWRHFKVCISARRAFTCQDLNQHNNLTSPCIACYRTRNNQTPEAGKCIVFLKSFLGEKNDLRYVLMCCTTCRGGEGPAVLLTPANRMDIRACCITPAQIKKYTNVF